MTSNRESPYGEFVLMGPGECAMPFSYVQFMTDLIAPKPYQCHAIFDPPRLLMRFWDRFFSSDPRDGRKGPGILLGERCKVVFKPSKYRSRVFFQANSHPHLHDEATISGFHVSYLLPNTL